MLKPIKQSRASDRVYEQIRDIIFRGELRPGERLMAERELAEVLKVGRPTVREAIQKLSEHGLVESRRGVGTFVVEESSERKNKSLLQVLNGQEFTTVEFFEVRLALECNSAALAAKRATEEDIRLLEKNIDDMRKERVTNERSMLLDTSFHMNIAYATKNTVQIHLMRSFYDHLYYGLNHAFSAAFHTPGIDDMMFDQHVALLKAIISRDEESAYAIMKLHIGKVLEICREHTI